MISFKSHSSLETNTHMHASRNIKGTRRFPSFDTSADSLLQVISYIMCKGSHAEDVFLSDFKNVTQLSHS
jgi:hypothetical protein